MAGNNGFLTAKDKEFLRGELEYTGEHAKQNRYERREAIAERTREAFHDFALLYKNLGEGEENRIFDVPGDERNEFEYALQDTIAFLYYSLESEAGNDPRITKSRSFDFSEILKDGVRRGEGRRQGDDFPGVVIVSFQVSPTSKFGGHVNWERVLESLGEADVNDVSDSDLRLLMALAINPTDRLRELADLIEEKRGGRYLPPDSSSHDPEEAIEMAPSLRELIERAKAE